MELTDLPFHGSGRAAKAQSQSKKGALLVLALWHQLIPSVYASIAIGTNVLGKPDDVGFSGPALLQIALGNIALRQ